MAPKSKRPPKHSRPAPKAKAAARTLTLPPPKLTQPGVGAGNPQFGESKYTPDPTQYLHAVTDNMYYKQVDKETVNQLIQKIPPPRDPKHLLLSLADVYGSHGSSKVAEINSAKQIVFHAVGDTGPTSGPKTVVEVADKMRADMQEANPADVPSFFYHLGDVVYNFGEDEYYYDQFFDPFRDYNAPIVAIAGNHDGEVYPGDPSGSLQAFRKVFCAGSFQRLPEAGGLSRTSMIQPGVYFAFDAPFVRLIGLYSNVLEDPGVISSEGGKYPRVSDEQIAYLTNQLNQIKSSNFQGAVIVAVHHPPQVVGRHGCSPTMLKEMDACFSSAGVYPHAVLSGHAHNYQRFTRIEGGRETPYVVAGMGGHNSQPPFGKMVLPPRPPFTIGEFRCDNYSANYGYLRVVVTQQQLRIEYHDATTGLNSKSPSDVATVDLASHTLVV
jgi:Calcineurin-like phosphoesterase/Iron/zinc purple acid phosphatase-like protein C